MSRYLAYSTFIHAAAFLALLFAAHLAAKPTAYYGFQFMGGQSGFGTGKLEPAPVKSAAPPAPASEAPPLSEDLERVAVAKKTPPKK